MEGAEMDPGDVLAYSGEVSGENEALENTNANSSHTKANVTKKQNLAKKVAIDKKV